MATAPLRRAAAPLAAANRPAAEIFNLGDLSQYSSGFGLPDGDWVFYWNVILQDPVDKNGNPIAGRQPRLGVLVEAYPLADADPLAGKKTQFYSFGSSAHLSWAPNPQDGKSIVAIPGGPGAAPNNSTNFAELLKSLYDCGLPQGYFVGDFTALDGIWVHTAQMPEPESRKGMASNNATSEVQEQRKDQKIAVVTDILDGGRIWEGQQGGIPAAPPTPAAPVRAAAPAPRAAAPAPRTAPAPARAAAPPARAAAPPLRPAAAPAPVAQAPTDVDDESIRAAAAAGIYDVLQTNPSGLLKLQLSTSVFPIIAKKFSEDMASAVAELFFKSGSDDNLNSVLGEWGYTVSGPKVVVAG